MSERGRQIEIEAERKLAIELIVQQVEPLPVNNFA